MSSRISHDAFAKQSSSPRRFYNRFPPFDTYTAERFSDADRSVGARGCSYLPSIRLLKAKQELIGVTADRRVEHIFGVIIVLVCEN
jgi:hypothetical protein